MKIYTAKMDRPMGYVHHGTTYPINYGYIEGIIAGDGEEQDVYILSNLPENQKASDIHWKTYCYCPQKR